MKAHGQKKNGGHAGNKGLIDIHAQEGQALTSSLSGTPALPRPHTPIPVPASPPPLLSLVPSQILRLQAATCNLPLQMLVQRCHPQMQNTSSHLPCQLQLYMQLTLCFQAVL